MKQYLYKTDNNIVLYYNIVLTIQYCSCSWCLQEHTFMWWHTHAKICTVKKTNKQNVASLPFLVPLRYSAVCVWQPVVYSCHDYIADTSHHNIFDNTFLKKTSKTYFWWASSDNISYISYDMLSLVDSTANP